MGFISGIKNTANCSNFETVDRGTKVQSHSADIISSVKVSVEVSLNFK